MMKRIQKGLHEEKQKNKIYVDKLKQNIATMENEAQQAEEEKVRNLEFLNNKKHTFKLFLLVTYCLKWMTKFQISLCTSC